MCQCQAERRKVLRGGGWRLERGGNRWRYKREKMGIFKKKYSTLQKLIQVKIEEFFVRRFQVFEGHKRWAQKESKEANQSPTIYRLHKMSF